ncbi:hypothetical protein HAZT_HAZT009310 [Hyalella azteca]|nr:hypothetical protein HAZT_HAZT009310 [Hyalella azteca]
MKEQMRTNERELRKAGTSVTRNRNELEREEKKLEAEIKKLAKTPGNQEALRVLAKQLVLVRKQKTRSYAAQSRITGISCQQKAMGANVKLAESMKSATSTMASMNKMMNPQAVAQDMRNFEKAAAQLNMTDEVVNDTLDDILNESGDEEEGDQIVQQVLEEIGIEMGSAVRGAPTPAAHLPGATKTSDVMTDDQLMESLAKLRAT